MSADAKKRQKKLEKKAAKRKEKRRVQLRRQSTDPLDRFAAMSKYPVLDCGISDSIAQEGIGWVNLSRETPNGMVAVASFLVDTYCLGVKDINAHVMSRSEYVHEYRSQIRRASSFRQVSPAEALKFLEAAVDYAAKLGFDPYPDYDQALLLFGTVDPTESDAVFEFGENGQPHFIAGPYDTPARCEQILNTLLRTCGPDQCHFTIPIQSGNGFVPFDDMDEEVDEVEDEDEIEDEIEDDEMPAQSDWRRTIKYK